MNISKDQEVQELKKEVAELKKQVKNGNQSQGYGANRGGRGGHVVNRGGNGSHRGGRSGSSSNGASVGDVTRSKLQETCSKFNSGSPCDGSCGLKHRCNQVGML